MAKELDNKKMWEAMAKFAPTKETLLWINMCVESQGFKLNDNFEIVPVEEHPEWDKPDICKGCNNVKGCIACVDGSNWAHIEEPELSHQELTEFEKAVLDIIPDHRTHTDSVEEFAKRNANRLLSIARKQFIEDCMDPLYRPQWLKDMLKKAYDRGYERAYQDVAIERFND